MGYWAWTSVCGARREVTAIDRSASCKLLLRTRSKLTNNCFFFGDKILDLESDLRKLGSCTMLRSIIRILRASLVHIDTEMAKKYAEQQHPAVCGKLALDDMPQDVCQH